MTAAAAMHFLSYELRPAEDNSDREGIGGAFVSAWIKAASLDAARELASTHLRDSGWVVLETLMERPVTLASCPEESREHFRQAEAQGEVFVIHAFPPEPADA
jgi:hypothetical protein